MQTHSRYLWILRHAKAEPYQSNDFERNLAKKGIKQMRLLSQMLSDIDKPELILSSPAHRARQSAELLCEHLSIDVSRIHWDERIYEASTSQLINVLQNSPDATHVMLVGHNPGLEGLFAYLISGKLNSSFYVDSQFMLKTAMLAQIQMPGNWDSLQPGCGELNAVLHPDLNN